MSIRSASPPAGVGARRPPPLGVALPSLALLERSHQPVHTSPKAESPRAGQRQFRLEQFSPLAGRPEPKSPTLPSVPEPQEMEQEEGAEEPEPEVGDNECSLRKLKSSLDRLTRSRKEYNRTKDNLVKKLSDIITKFWAKRIVSEDILKNGVPEPTPFERPGWEYRAIKMDLDDVEYEEHLRRLEEQAQARADLARKKERALPVYRMLQTLRELLDVLGDTPSVEELKALSNSRDNLEPVVFEDFGMKTLWESMKKALGAFVAGYESRLKEEECFKRLQTDAAEEVQKLFDQHAEQLRIIDSKLGGETPPTGEAKDFTNAYIELLAKAWEAAKKLDVKEGLPDVQMDRVVAHLQSVKEGRDDEKKQKREDLEAMLDQKDEVPSYLELVKLRKDVGTLGRELKEKYETVLNSHAVAQKALQDALAGFLYSASDVEKFRDELGGELDADTAAKVAARIPLLQKYAVAQSYREFLDKYVKMQVTTRPHTINRRIEVLENLPDELKDDNDATLAADARKRLEKEGYEKKKQLLDKFLNPPASDSGSDRGSPLPFEDAFSELQTLLDDETSELTPAAATVFTAEYMGKVRKEVGARALVKMNAAMAADDPKEIDIDAYKNWGVPDESLEEARQYNAYLKKEGRDKILARKYLYMPTKTVRTQSSIPAAGVFNGVLASPEDFDAVFGEWLEFSLVPKGLADPQVTAVVEELVDAVVGGEEDVSFTDNDPRAFTPERHWFSTWRKHYVLQDDDDEHVRLLLAARNRQTATTTRQSAVFKTIGDRARNFEAYTTLVATKQVALDRLRAEIGIQKKNGLETIPMDFEDGVLGNSMLSLLGHRARALEAQSAAITNFAAVVAGEEKKAPAAPTPDIDGVIAPEVQQDYLKQKAVLDVRKHRVEVRKGIKANVALAQRTAKLAFDQEVQKFRDPDGELAKLRADNADLLAQLEEGAIDPDPELLRKFAALKAKMAALNLASGMAKRKLSALQKTTADTKQRAKIKVKMEQSFVATAAALITFREATDKAQMEFDDLAQDKKQEKDGPPSVPDLNGLLLGSLFTAEQYDALFFDDPEPTTADTRASQWSKLVAKGSTAPISVDDISDISQAVFNKGYARKLLLEHVRNLVKFDEKAQKQFVQLSSCLGSDEDTAVDKLMPFFESMLRYRNTMVAVKLLLVSDHDRERKTVAAAEKTEKNRPALLTRTKQKLDVERNHIPVAFWVYARQLLALDQGRLPDAFVQSQPAFLPLRIFAPPRVGKSATSLVAASLAKRLGMLSFYACGPNKITPIGEWKQKLESIGWTPAVESAGTRTAKAKKHLVNYDAVTVDDVFGPPLYSTNTLVEKDMIIYSHNGPPDDLERAGALLATLKMSHRVVFHIRDESQFLNKKEEVDTKFGAIYDAPPPRELTMLRHYYGNLYSLNCLVSATLFPTLAETGLWGYFGSMKQNTAVGLSAVAVPTGKGGISERIGAEFLPKLVPALTPEIPASYMGAEKLMPWTRNSRVVQLLANAANHTAIAGMGEEHMQRPEEFEEQSRTDLMPLPAELSAPDPDDPGSLLQHDYAAICLHFEDWLSFCEDRRVDTGEPVFVDADAAPKATRKTRSGKAAAQASAAMPSTPALPKDVKVGVVPMYIGALNHVVVGAGLASWVRAFGALSTGGTSTRPPSWIRTPWMPGFHVKII